MNKALHIRSFSVKNQNDIGFRDKDRVDLNLPRRFKHELTRFPSKRKRFIHAIALYYL